MYFGSSKSPSTAKLADFGLTISSSNKYFKQSFVFESPWFNYPPATCIIASKLIYKIPSCPETLLKQVEDYIPTFSRYGFNHFSAIYTMGNTQRVANNYSGSVNDFCCSIDLYGFALTLYNLNLFKSPSKVSNKIDKFCMDATNFAMDDRRALYEMDQLIINYV